MRAGDFQLKDFGGTDSTPSGDGTFGRQRFTLTFDTRFGYDDNTLSQPDTATVDLTNAAGQIVIVNGKPVARTVNVNTSSSAFMNFALGVGYTAANPRLSLVTGADIGVNYYFDRPGRDYDINGGLSARLAYKASPRLLLEASTYNAYQSDGDYGATDLTNFNGVFNGGTRTPGTTAQRNGDYFYTTDLLSASYQFAPRFSVTLSDTIVAFAYDSTPYSTDEDRIENYVQTELDFHLQPAVDARGRLSLRIYQLLLRRQ